MRRQAEPAAAGAPAIVPAPRLAPTEATRRWAALLQQIFEVDPLACPPCRGPMRIIAFITLSSSCWKPFSNYKLESSSFPKKKAAYRMAVRTYLAMLAMGLTARDSVSRTFAKNPTGGRIV